MTTDATKDVVRRHRATLQTRRQHLQSDLLTAGNILHDEVEQWRTFRHRRRHRLYYFTRSQPRQWTKTTHQLSLDSVGLITVSFNSKLKQYNSLVWIWFGIAWLNVRMCGIDIFYFGLVSVRFFFGQNSDSVRNEFGSVQFKKYRSVRIL